jgi:hypothetical protein
MYVLAETGSFEPFFFTGEKERFTKEKAAAARGWMSELS